MAVTRRCKWSQKKNVRVLHWYENCTSARARLHRISNCHEVRKIGSFLNLRLGKSVLYLRQRCAKRSTKSIVRAIEDDRPVAAPRSPRAEKPCLKWHSQCFRKEFHRFVGDWNSLCSSWLVLPKFPTAFLHTALRICVFPPAPFFLAWCGMDGWKYLITSNYVFLMLNLMLCASANNMIHLGWRPSESQLNFWGQPMSPHF